MTRLDALVVADFGNEILQEAAVKRDTAWAGVVECVDAVAVADRATSEHYKAGVLMSLAGATPVRQLVWQAFLPVLPAVDFGDLGPVGQAMAEMAARVFSKPLPFTDIGDDQETGENDKRSMT